MTNLPQRVLDLASAAAAEHGVEVLEARIMGGQQGRTLSVVLDADGPIPSETVELVARQLSRSLDDEDPLEGAYTLEVGTPGLDRPLTTARDFRRQRGHKVRLIPAEGANLPVADRSGQVEGIVVTADDDAVTLNVKGRTVAVPLSDVGKGKVVLPW